MYMYSYLFSTSNFCCIFLYPVYYSVSRYLTLIIMAYSSPDVEWLKIWSVLAVPSLQLIQKFYVEDTNKMSKSQQLIDSK